MLNFDVRITDVNRSEVDEALKYGQYVLDNLVINDSNYYIPIDTHNAERSALINSQIGSGRIVWIAPYIRSIYYGENYNFSTDQNPNARALWFEAAKAQKRDYWIQKAEQAVMSRL